MSINNYNSDENNNFKNVLTTLTNTCKKLLNRLLLPTKIVLVLWIVGCIGELFKRSENDRGVPYVITVLVGACMVTIISQKICRKRLHKFDDEIIGQDHMDAEEFIYFCRNLLENNFSDVKIVDLKSNKGIDIIAYKNGEKYGIKCKCYSKNAGHKSVQEAYTGKAVYECDKVIVLSNRYFTNDALELSEKIGVILWDSDVLNKMIKQSKNN